MHFFEIFYIFSSIWAHLGGNFATFFRFFEHGKKNMIFERCWVGRRWPGGTGRRPRIPFGKGWDLARRCPHDAYGRPRPGAAYLKGFALCRRPPILDSPAFWLATSFWHQRPIFVSFGSHILASWIAIWVFWGSLGTPSSTPWGPDGVFC